MDGLQLYPGHEVVTLCGQCSVPLCGLWRVEAVLTPTFVTLFGPFYTLKYRNITGSTYYGETSTFVVTKELLPPDIALKFIFATMSLQ